jgi:hypothetical protein
MKPFPIPLDLRNLADGSKEHWVTLAPFVFRDASDGTLYIVPAGMRNDLASVPRIFWTEIDPSNDVALGAIVHDWLYATRGVVRPWLPQISRAKADAVLYRALRANGVGVVRARTMWAAVRVGGASAWRTGESVAHLFHSHVEPSTLRMIAEAEVAVDAAAEPGPEVMG